MFVHPSLLEVAMLRPLRRASAPLPRIVESVDEDVERDVERSSSHSSEEASVEAYRCGLQGEGDAARTDAMLPGTFALPCQEGVQQAAFPPRPGLEDVRGLNHLCHGRGDARAGTTGMRHAKAGLVFGQRQAPPATLSSTSALGFGAAWSNASEKGFRPPRMHRDQVTQVGYAKRAQESGEFIKGARLSGYAVQKPLPSPSAASAIRFCSGCGGFVGDVAAFCPFCGVKIRRRGGHSD